MIGVTVNSAQALNMQLYARVCAENRANAFIHRSVKAGRRPRLPARVTDVRQSLSISTAVSLDGQASLRDTGHRGGIK